MSKIRNGKYILKKKQYFACFKINIFEIFNIYFFNINLVNIILLKV